ncbi:hypothetical protein Ccrd_010188, partial [Cynara cardunculus var. scolymus]
MGGGEGERLRDTVDGSCVWWHCWFQRDGSGGCDYVYKYRGSGFGL